jgi:outer membrane receptor for ferrienterochelin and colicin
LEAKRCCAAWCKLFCVLAKSFVCLLFRVSFQNGFHSFVSVGVTNDWRFYMVEGYMYSEYSTFGFTSSRLSSIECFLFPFFCEDVVMNMLLLSRARLSPSICFILFVALMFTFSVMSVAAQGTVEIPVQTTLSTDSTKKDLDNLSLEELLDVQISVASNLVSDKDKQPVSVTTVSRRQLELCGARNLMNALQLFVPGFFVTQTQDNVIAAFRGLAPDNNSKVMLLVNGQNMNTEFFWGPPSALLLASNFDYIERVEVIRGPGSVTLGQGALLGVINIVTTRGAELTGDAANHVEAALTAGADNLWLGRVAASAKVGEVRTAFTISRGVYGGQVYRNEGNARRGNEGFAGGTVYDMGHRLNRNDNLLMQANAEYKGFEVNVLYTDTQYDLYNFYRDREVFGQSLASVKVSYKADVSNDVQIKVSGSFIQDDIRLSSLTGTSMGGTREDRYGASAVVTANDFLTKGNKLAAGVEYRRFEMGKANRFGNNFIANKIGTFNPTTANRDLIMSYRLDINVISAFFEDFFAVNDHLDVFAAARFDNHTGWGSNVAPRVGALFAASNDLHFRASYQMGFRGGVGLSYSGGYRNDGYLRSANLQNIESARIPGETNRPVVSPEVMNSIEIAVNYQIATGVKLDVVGFYNSVNKVLDVGVIYRDPVNTANPQPGQYNVTPVGSGSTRDIPGDWNGFWFFKNALGSINQIGAEASLSYNSDILNITLSHSFVAVASITVEQRTEAVAGNSMYLAFNKADQSIHYKACPENVTRLNVLATPFQGFDVAVNALWYSQWYAPDGSIGASNLLLNLGASYDITPNLELSVNGSNLLNQTNLSPMTANAGGPGLQPGAPTVETATVWGRIRIRL